MPPKIPPRDRLIVALDLPGVEPAEAMVARLGDSVTFYKIGYQLAFAGGLPLVRKLADQGKKVFIDLKLHDIGNTVARGVESIARLGATFLTVHAYPQTMKAALEGRAGSDLKILAVTVLTSYDDGDLRAAGAVPPAAGNAESRDGADRGQRFAAEAERADILERVGNLRGAVAPDREFQIGGIHARAVVADAQQRLATA